MIVKLSSTVDAIMFTTTVKCPRDDCSGEVSVPVMLKSGERTGEKNKYQDESTKNGICSKCDKPAKVQTTLETLAEPVDCEYI